MKVWIMMFGMGLVVTLGANGLQATQAADLPLVRSATPAKIFIRSRTRTRPVIVHHRYALKTIGMFCNLPPDVIVARNWNGPQCRYVDNLILPPWRVVFDDR
jgi:hypothetical protein